MIAIRRISLAVVLVMAVTAGVVPSVPVTSAQACGCVTSDVGEQLEFAEVVVRGVITDVDRPKMLFRSTTPVNYTVELSQVWQGEPSNPLVATTAASGASCGLPDLHEGQDVVVAGRERGHQIEIRLCGGSGIADRERVAAVVAVFGDGSPGGPVVPVSDDRTGAVIAGVVLVIIAGTGVGVLARQRRSRVGKRPSG